MVAPGAGFRDVTLYNVMHPYENYVRKQVKTKKKKKKGLCQKSFGPKVSKDQNKRSTTKIE